MSYPITIMFFARYASELTLCHFFRYARAQQIKAINPTDDFCMQIDAHTDVVQDWDVRIVEQWFETENE